MAIDNDWACRELFFGFHYQLFTIASFWVLLTIVSATVFFLVYRKRMQESV